MTAPAEAPDETVSASPEPPARRLRVPNWIRHPLWWMPDIPAEQRRSFARIWDDFTQVESLADGRHDINGWSGHSGDFVMCCVRIPVAEQRHDLEDFRAELGTLHATRVHPPAFLHVAVQELGFITERPKHREEFTTARLEEFLGYIEGPIGDFAPFPMTLGGANSFTDAPFLEVHDNGWLSRIHFRMRDFVIVPPDKHFPYLPFATVAHYMPGESADMARQIVETYRATTFAQFAVNGIDVVRLSTAEPYPQAEVIRTIELGRHRIEAPIRPTLPDPPEHRFEER